MSLIHWWPLCGDVLDKASNSVSTPSNLTTAVGKTGPAYYFNGTNSNISIPLSVDDVVSINNGNVSVAMWVCLDSTSTGWDQIFTIGNQGTSWTDIRIGFDHSVSEGLKLTISNGSSATGRSCGTTTIHDGEWHHLAGTCANGNLELYVDGVLKNTYSAGFSPAVTTGQYVLIAGSSSERGQGKIQDVRIYDHVLSQAEVKEISKAMIMHYSFDDLLTEETVNLLPESQQTQSNTAGTIDVSSGLVNGATYTLSTYVTRDPSCTSTNPRLTIRFFYSDGTNTSTSKYNDGGASYPKDGVERFYYITATANSAKTLTSVGGWLMDHSSGTGKKMTATKSQLEINTHPTPYTNNSRESHLYNEAGLAQPTNISNVKLSEDSAVGKYSLKCNKSTWIKTPANTNGQKYMTLSAWVNPTDYSGDCVIIGGCYLAVNSSGKLSAYCYGKSPAGYHNGSTTIPTNAWTHIAVVWDGSYCIGYVNGNQDFKVASTGTANATNHEKKDIGMENGGSRAFNGLIDDARVYNTALSVDEIRDLYRAKAYISNLGDIMSNQFVENFENIIDEVGFNKAASSTSGNGSMELRNGVLSYGLAAPAYYVAGNSQASSMIFNGKFKANTQYYFDLWIDADTMWYSGGSKYVPCGFTLLYTDGTSETLTVTSTNGADGWKHLEFFSNSSKSIHGLGVYYYIGTKWYLRHDSGIYEVDMDGAQITSKKAVETTQVLTTDFENNAMIHMSGSIIARNIIEI